jgi:hypothetical protein
MLWVLVLEGGTILKLLLSTRHGIWGYLAFMGKQTFTVLFNLSIFSCLGRCLGIVMITNSSWSSGNHKPCLMGHPCPQIISSNKSPKINKIPINIPDEALMLPKLAYYVCEKLTTKIICILIMGHLINLYVYQHMILNADMLNCTMLTLFCLPFTFRMCALDCKCLNIINLFC